MGLYFFRWDFIPLCELWCDTKNLWNMCLWITKLPKALKSFAKSFQTPFGFVCCKFFLESNMPQFWLYFRETWKTQLDLTTSLWWFILYDLKGICCSSICFNSIRWPFFGKSEGSCLYFWLNVFHLASCFPYQSLTSSLLAIFYTIWHKTGKIVSVGPFANVFVIHS